MTLATLILASLSACQPAGADSDTRAAAGAQVAAFEGDAIAENAADNTAPATAAADWPDKVPNSLARVPFDRSHEGLGPAAATLQVVRADLAALSPEQRAEASRAVVEMITNCPFNRSSVQVAMVLQHVLDRHDDPALAPLRSAVDDHVAALDLLGATALPLPRQGDYLHRDMAGLVTGPQLLAAPDPIATAHQLLAQVLDLVGAYDAQTTDRLEAAGAVLAPATHDQWPMKNQLLGVRVELKRLADTDLDPRLQADVVALHALLDEYLSLTC